MGTHLDFRVPGWFIEVLRFTRPFDWVLLSLGPVLLYLVPVLLSLVPSLLRIDLELT